MEWIIKPPKILHVYWGGGKMAYIRYMTVKSFIRFNPDWKVKLWLPKVNSVKRTWNTRELNYDELCDDYRQKLFDLPIEREEVDFKQFGFSNSISEVHKSDYLRLYILANTGGLWSDMDILYFKPITELAINVSENKDKDTFLCVSHYGHSAGFLMSSAPNKYYKILTQICLKSYNPQGYQSIGASMFNKYYPRFDLIERISPAVNIDMDAVYSHDAFHVHELLNGTLPKFIDKTIGCHWYAGNPIWGDFMKETNGGVVNLKNNVIGNLLKQLNEG